MPVAQSNGYGSSKLGRQKTTIRKLKKAGIPAALEAHDRIQAVSDGLRAAKELEPVPEGNVVREWRAYVAKKGTPKAKGHASIRSGNNRASLAKVAAKCAAASSNGNGHEPAANVELFRMSGAELRKCLPNANAAMEIRRRKDKRTAKAAA